VQGDDVGESDAPRLPVMVREGERVFVGVASCDTVTDRVPEFDPVRVSDGDADCDLLVLREVDCERVPLEDGDCVEVDP